MNKIILYLISAFIFTNSTVNGLEFGSCPLHSVQKDFRLNQFTGVWYQYTSMNTATFFQGKGNCVLSIYRETADKNVISVQNQHIMIGSNKTIIKNGSAELENPSSGEGKLIVTFKSHQWWFKTSVDYWVLTTDYINFAIVYSCKSWFGLLYSSTYWILTREQIIVNKDTLRYIHTALTQHNLNYSDFERTTQTGCY